MLSQAKNSHFEGAFGEAQAIVASMHGYLSHELHRCIENASGNVLRVKWNALEDHTERFRNSDEHQQWRALLPHFYAPFPLVEHYQKVY